MIVSSDAFLWLPFANLGSMFETLKESAFSKTIDFNEPLLSSHVSIFDTGKEFFNGIAKFISSSFEDEEKLSIASSIRNIFNLTTTSPKPLTVTMRPPNRFLPKIIPVDRPTTRKPAEPIPQPFSTPYTPPPFFFSTTPPDIPTTYNPMPSFRFTTTTEPIIIKFVKTPKPTTNLPIEFETSTERTRYATFAPNIRITTTEPKEAYHTFSTIPETTTTTSPSTTTTTTTTATTTTTPQTTTTLIKTPKNEESRVFTKPIYQIWPTTSTTTTTPTPDIDSHGRLEHTPLSSIIRAIKVWKQVTPSLTPDHTTSIVTNTHPAETTTPSYESSTLDSMYYSSTAGIPYIIKSKKFTRPPVNEKILVTPQPLENKYDTCVSGQRCSLKLKSFETSDQLFQYCYSHSTMIDEQIQSLLKDTQTAALPVHISWTQSVTPEVLTLVQTLMTIYRPSRCLVIGVFTGLGLLGIANHVDSRGIVVALEHPAYAVFWEKVGQKHAKRLSTAQLSRIQIRTSESIEKSLPRLAANEPNTFDFVFMDDFKRENYLDDYEHSVRLLRSGGLLVINQALSGGGVLSSVENMTNDDKVIRNMNIRIKQDSRVIASLLPYGGGTWIISKI
ncbi:unnamed protein product [Caenorhabditis bovis]|uniref:Uncharacterized protein n=1 Tax=Caenorhabditis bovis TaxID=2654633 RepID=A0A8S1EJ14_9PELO|nr:unnamed protein product [Caenorhabditis bovis]